MGILWLIDRKICIEIKLHVWINGHTLLLSSFKPLKIYEENNRLLSSDHYLTHKCKSSLSFSPLSPSHFIIFQLLKYSLELFLKTNLWLTSTFLFYKQVTLANGWHSMHGKMVAEADSTKQPRFLLSQTVEQWRLLRGQGRTKLPMNANRVHVTILKSQTWVFPKGPHFTWNCMFSGDTWGLITMLYLHCSFCLLPVTFSSWLGCGPTLCPHCFHSLASAPHCPWASNRFSKKSFSTLYLSPTA